ncbi:MAG: hypothetical protein BZ137_08635, partial [Methanosphaera sp. rholeuAM130]
MYKRNYKLLNSKFREFLLPTVFTSMAGNISIFIDSILVSMFIGTISLSVMQIIAPVTTLVNLIYWMVGLGGSLVCSISRAEFDKDRSNSIFTSSILSMIAIGIIILVLSLIFSDAILRVLCNSNELRPLVYQFFRYYIFGLPFLCYMMSMSYFIRVDGFTRLPFISLVIANLCNLILDVVLIKYLNLGLNGAALATTIGYIVGSVCMSTYFLKKDRTIRFVKVKLSSFIHYLKDICKSGYSTASGQLYLTVKLYVLNSILLAVSGNIGLAAFNMCYNSMFVISIFLIGIAQSMSPIVGVYFKEKDFDGVEYVIRKSFRMVLAISLIFVIILTIYPDILLLIFSVKNPEHIPYIMNAVRIYSLSYLGLGVNFLYLFYAQAIQKDKLANIIQILEGLILPITSIIILSLAFGEMGLWSSFFISELLVVLFLIVYSRIVNKKSNGKYHGFFINKSNDDKNFIEYTINAKLEEATGLSSKINDYLGNNIESTRISLAVEEILVNIIKLNAQMDTIDVYLRKNDDNIILSIKDDGIEYNP